MVHADAELLSRATLGDRRALAALLERDGVEVARSLQIDRRWQGVIEADDVMQVTYIEAFLRIGDFVPEGPGTFPAWLRRIAENNLRDAIRGLERQKRPNPARRVAAGPGGDSHIALLDSLAGPGRTPSRSAASHEIERAIESALQELPEDYSRVLRLYELEGRTGPEVAAAIGRSHGAVKMLLARARDRLREVLGTQSAFFTHPA